MGLCKCRVVTSLFCFQHKQSVCEKCIASQHKTCVIRSYIQWLQDSDFDPNCTFCKKPMDNLPTIRFTCLDVFHQGCVEQYARSLPAHTAPAGFTCMTCSAPIIPPPNVASPIADDLREFLATQEWAQPPKNPPATEIPSPGQQVEEAPALQREGLAKKGGAKNREKDQGDDQSTGAHRGAAATNVILSRKAGGQSSVALSEDSDEDKYKQRSGALGRIFWFTFGSISKSGKRTVNRWKLLVALFLLLILSGIFWAMSAIPLADQDPE